MNEIIQLWNTIVSTNTFNFLIMMAILVLIFKKVNVIGILEKTVDNVKNTINKSSIEKEESYKKLVEAKNKSKNLDIEIQEILATAHRKGEDLSRKISEDTKEKISKINENMIRMVQTEEKKFSADLTERTVIASISTAESHIKSIFEASPELHDRYIQASLNELDRIKL